MDRLRFRTGVELAERLNAEFAAGRATRPALEVERRLAVCRTCDQFRGDNCAELSLGADQCNGMEPNYVELLTREEHFCNRWHVLLREVAPRRRTPAVETAYDALDRLHRAGTVRTAAERRAARAAGRRKGRAAERRD